MFSGFRYRRGLTQAAFAEQSGLPLELIMEWEAHKRAPSPSALRDIATSFNVSVSDLLHKPPRDVSLRYGGTKAWSGPEPLAWNVQMQSRWGVKPFSQFGYLRLQLSALEAPRYYPLSGEQAWWLNDQLLPKPGSSGVIAAKTMNNRVLIFGIAQVHSASLLSKAEATARSDFQLGWDADGLPPEIYRLLRNWARTDNSEYFGSSPALHKRRDEILDRPGMRRRKTVTGLVDHTLIHHRDGRTIALSADAASLITAIRALPLGMLTFYLGERDSGAEWLMAIDNLLLIDMPANDLEAVRQYDVIVKAD